MSLPTDIANRSLDAAGSDKIIGDLEEGSETSKVVLRHYGPVLRQLLRAAHWDCCRRQAPMQLLADATGQTPSVGTVVPVPWTYEYAYPTDCVRARFVPMTNPNIATGTPAGNISIPSTPIVSGISTPPSNQMRLTPTRFLITSDFNYPAQVTPGPGGTEWWNIQGISPVNRTVILSNMQNATLVYTCLQVYPSLWDAMFEAAFVAALAERIAVPLAKDKKIGMVFRDKNIMIARDHIKQARVTDGNEGWSTTDHIPDWIRIRSGGAGRSSGLLNGGDGPGCLGYGWDSYGFGNGSTF